MAVYTTAGTTLAIATGAAANSRPADASAFGALTWQVVGEVENLGTFGDTANLVTFLSVGDSRVRKRKGARNAGTMEIVCGHDPLDAGQVAVLAASNSQLVHNFRITENDKADSNDTNSISYFTGLVMSGAKNLGGTDDITKRNFTVEIDSAIVYVPATVVT
jgi:hypothetical protein